LSEVEGGETEEDAKECGEEDEDGLELATGEPVKRSGDDVEPDLRGGDGAGAGVRVNEGGGSLGDDCSGVGVVDPFVDMEREVVVVLEMREEHHEKAEAEEYKQEDGCRFFEESSWYLGERPSTE